jgi:hypothetical protein
MKLDCTVVEFARIPAFGAAFARIPNRPRLVVEFARIPAFGLS